MGPNKHGECSQERNKHSAEVFNNQRKRNVFRLRRSPAKGTSDLDLRYQGHFVAEETQKSIRVLAANILKPLLLHSSFNIANKET